MSVSRVDKVSYATAGFGDVLTHDLACGVPAALPFFPAQRWDEVAERVAARAYPREELCRVLERSAAESGAPPGVLDSIALLRQPRTYVVATGQQVGFLGGPLYTLHKALSAIALARKLEQEAQGAARFVPVFWAAGDDHDLAEIDHADFLEADGTLRRVRLVLSPESQGCSACDARLDGSQANVEALRAELRGALGSEELAEETIKLYVACDLSAAFTRLLYRWLGGHGLVVAQSSSVRALAAPVLQRELHEYDITSRLLQEAAVRMQKHGYKPGLSARERAAPHFFIASEPHRLRVRLEPAAQGDRFQERGSAFEARGVAPRAFTRDELANLAATQPRLFSADAALRPIVQQHVFPVVAAVLGPGEIAYWAQLKQLHDHFGVVWPLIVPRATMTLLDAHADKALRRLGLAPTAPEVFQGFEALQKLAAPGGATGAKLEAHISGIRTAFEALAGEAQAADAGLKPMVDKARARIEHELGRIAEKTKASLSQREDAGGKRLRYLAALARPRNSPQERVLNTGQFLARRPTLAHDLLNVIEPSGREHMIVALE